MGISIKKIDLQNLGPIRKISWEMGMINLVYGDNEKGKSYLVEFLIRSLFKIAGWKLRKATGNGKVKVEGIENRIIEFSPSSPRKLEDFLLERYIGLPPDFSKLLVMKGTEAELGKGEETDRMILRRYLSHREILDRIQGDISETIKKCSVDGYDISGAQRGEIKKRKESKDDFERIENLFNEVENQYLGGDRKILEDRKRVLESRFRLLSKAKCNYAYEISQGIRQLQGELDDINSEKLEELRDEVNNYHTKKGDFEARNSKLQTLVRNTEHYEWLKNAEGIYERYNLESVTGRPSFFFAASLTIMVVLLGIFVVLRLLVCALTTLAGIALVGWRYKRKYDQSLADTGRREEVLKLEREYKRRFGQNLTGLALIKKNLEEMKEDYEERKVLKRTLNQEEENLRKLKMRISEGISEFVGEGSAPEKWKEELRKKQDEKRRLEEQITDGQIELSRLQVDQSEYESDKPEIEFDSELYKKTEADLEKTREKISEKESNLDTLKQLICTQTADDISIGWQELIEHLASKRDEILEEYKNVTAEIIGKKFVFEVLEELYRVDDQEVKSALESDVIKDVLPEVTKHYNRITLEEDNLIVSDSYSDFPLSEISDGAKEQVFLALRIGFAMRWFKENPLFVILDDAFLHSDYKRRPLLVGKMIELARNGWQIICFTFDDNIRELFGNQTAQFPDVYKYFDLNESGK